VLFSGWDACKYGLSCWSGYADLHFVIPETVEDRFGKGTYYGKGFCNGRVRYQTKENSEGSISIEASV
jgi:hypothetical protein